VQLGKPLMLFPGNIAEQIAKPAVENKAIELETLTRGILRVFHQPRDFPSSKVPSIVLKYLRS
jgi:hypothetical protein